MRYTRFITLIVVLLLLATPLAALAQDGPELEEYESEDGLFTLEYPAGWIPYVDEESPLPNVIFFNSEDGLTLYEDGGDPKSGDAAIFLFVLPTDFFTLLGMELTDDMTATEVTELIATAFFEPTEDDTETVVFGETEEFELEDGRMVGYLDIESDTEDGGFFAFEIGDGLVGMAVISTFPGEYDEDGYTLAEAVVESVEFTGTADDIMMMLFGTGDESTDGTGDDTSMGGDGEALVAERCSVCHSTDRIYNASKDATGWTATVDRMIGYGAQLDDAERQTVIDYLAGLN